MAGDVGKSDRLAAVLTTFTSGILSVNVISIQMLIAGTENVIFSNLIQ